MENYMLRFIVRVQSRFMAAALAQAVMILMALPLHADRDLDYFRSQLNAERFPKALSKLVQDTVSGNCKPAELEVRPNQVRDALMEHRRLLLSGLCAAGKGDKSLAERIFSQALAIRASSSDALFLRASARFELAKYSEAESDLAEALWFAKPELYSASEMHYLLGRIHEASDTEGASEKAVSAYQNAVSSDVAFTPARLALARLELIRGNPKSALPQLRQAVAAEPGNQWAKVLLAQALLSNADRLLNRNEIKEAGDITAQLVSSNGLSAAEREQALQLHVRALLSAGKAEEASKFLSRELKRAPGNELLLALQKQIQFEREFESEQLAQ